MVLGGEDDDSCVDLNVEMREGRDTADSSSKEGVVVGGGLAVLLVELLCRDAMGSGAVGMLFDRNGLSVGNRTSSDTLRIESSLLCRDKEGSSSVLSSGALLSLSNDSVIVVVIVFGVGLCKMQGLSRLLSIETDCIRFMS